MSALAMGIAFGVMPKLNLSAFLILAWLTLANQFARRVVIVTGLSFVASGFLYPYLAQIGNLALATQPTQFLLSIVDNIPILPWLRLNNPAVLGSLILSESVFVVLMIVGITLRKSRIWSRSETTFNETQHSELLPSIAYVGEYSLNDSQRDMEQRFVLPGHRDLVLVHSESQSVDLNLPKTKKTAVDLADREDYSNLEIRESIIEIVRFRTPEIVEIPPNSSRPTRVVSSSMQQIPIDDKLRKQMSLKLDLDSLIIKKAKSMNQVNQTIDLPRVAVELSMENTINIIQAGHGQLLSDESNTDAIHASDAATIRSNGTVVGRRSDEKPRDDALRYLLWHLNSVKDGSSTRERAS